MPDNAEPSTESEVALNIFNPAAVSVIVRRGNKYLLVLRANPPAQNMYAFPGGRLEPGETASQGALRELEEETGIVGTSATPYMTYDLNASQSAGSPVFQLTVFLVAEPGTTEPRPLDDAAALGWFTIDETKLLSMPPSMHHCLSKLAEATSRT